MTVAEWVTAVRILTVSAGGFAIGMMAVMIPRFLRLAMRTPWHRETRILPAFYMTLGGIGLGGLIVGALGEILEKFETPFVLWRSPLYLVSFLTIDLLSILIARDISRWLPEETDEP